MKRLLANLMVAGLLLAILSISCKKTKDDDLSTSSIDPQQVTIGNQVWMVKNLDVSTYRNGDPILHVTDPQVWERLTTGAWCWYKNDSANFAGYGKLYNWYAVNDPRGLAPNGWHVPSDAEWTTLCDFLGGEDVAGGKLKEAGTNHFRSPNAEATNTSGFTALPGGHRYIDTYANLGTFGYWWSSTEENRTQVLSRYLGFEYNWMGRYFYDKNLGFSVRCLRD